MREGQQMTPEQKARVKEGARKAKADQAPDPLEQMTQTEALAYLRQQRQQKHGW